MLRERELYTSSNGDSWSLCRDGHNRVFVLHRVNIPAGGANEIIELSDFLKLGHGGPEHQALRQLIGSLTD